MEGNNQEERVLSLWKTIQHYYKVFKSTCRLQTITLEMIVKKKANAKPKLRAKGGESRQLIPLAVQLAKDRLDKDPTAHNNTVFNLFSRMLDFQLTMGMTPFEPDNAKEACFDVCSLYKVLSEEKRKKQVWFLKPKVHLLQELGEYMVYDSGDPSNYWNYRDEDFVGFIAGMAFSRGGKRRARTTPDNVVTKYRALNG